MGIGCVGARKQSRVVRHAAQGGWKRQATALVVRMGLVSLFFQFIERKMGGFLPLPPAGEGRGEGLPFVCPWPLCSRRFRLQALWQASARCGTPLYLTPLPQAGEGSKSQTARQTGITGHFRATSPVWREVCVL